MQDVANSATEQVPRSSGSTTSIQIDPHNPQDLFNLVNAGSGTRISRESSPRLSPA